MMLQLMLRLRMVAMRVGNPGIFPMLANSSRKTWRGWVSVPVAVWSAL